MSDIEWKRVPFWANYLVQRDDGRYVAFENRPVIFADEWVKQDGMHEALHFGPNEMDWRDTLQERPEDDAKPHTDADDVMEEKKVYAMAPDGCLDYVTAGKVYLTRPCYQCGDDSEDMEYFDPDFYEPWAFSAWKCSTHLKGGDWVRLELTDEEAEAINAKLQERPEEAACDSDIEWSPWVKGDPEPFARFSDIQVDGQCYRIPMSDYKRITGIPDWSEAPEWALWLAQDMNGGWYWYGEEPQRDMSQWDSGMPQRRAGEPMAVLGRWEETLQKRPSDLLESHPNSELDADQYTVGGDTVNMPSHYTTGEIECIDAIQAQMTPEQFAGYLRGNCVKYIWRYQHKGGKESLLKAQWYLNRLIDVVE